ncbi:MAG: hypothetical protein HN816_10410, partial [Gammaproteobacteria bacterium]|nr:hypothetical protein [Gammaproteobacteria bacterium]
QGATSGIIEGATSLNLATATGADLIALLDALEARREAVISIKLAADDALGESSDAEAVHSAAVLAETSLTDAINAIEAVLIRTDDDLVGQAAAVNAATAIAATALTSLSSTLDDAQDDVAENALLNDLVAELTTAADLSKIDDAIDDAIASVAGT